MEILSKQVCILAHYLPQTVIRGNLDLSFPVYTRIKMYLFSQISGYVWSRLKGEFKLKALFCRNNGSFMSLFILPPFFVSITIKIRVSKHFFPVEYYHCFLFYVLFSLNSSTVHAFVNFKFDSNINWYFHLEI